MSSNAEPVKAWHELAGTPVRNNSANVDWFQQGGARMQEHLRRVRERAGLVLRRRLMKPDRRKGASPRASASSIAEPVHFPVDRAVVALGRLELFVATVPSFRTRESLDRIAILI